MLLSNYCFLYSYVANSRELSKFVVILTSVSDPETFFKDPDPGFFPNTDPDPGKKKHFPKVKFGGKFVFLPEK